MKRVVCTAGKETCGMSLMVFNKSLDTVPEFQLCEIKCTSDISYTHTTVGQHNWGQGKAKHFFLIDFLKMFWIKSTVFITIYWGLYLERRCISSFFEIHNDTKRWQYEMGHVSVWLADLNWRRNTGTYEILWYGIFCHTCTPAGLYY